MKQKYHFQRGELQYENATMPLSSSDIHTTNYHFQKCSMGSKFAATVEMYNFAFTQGAQKSLAIKV